MTGEDFEKLSVRKTPKLDNTSLETAENAPSLSNLSDTM